MFSAWATTQTGQFSVFENYFRVARATDFAIHFQFACDPDNRALNG